MSKILDFSSLEQYCMIATVLRRASQRDTITINVISNLDTVDINVLAQQLAKDSDRNVVFKVQEKDKIEFCIQ